MSLQSPNSTLQIHQVITEKLQTNGYLKLNQLSATFTDAGIDRAIYLGMGPKKWLSVNFPEFTIEGSNGKETIVFSKDPIASMNDILKLEFSRSNGRILFSAVPKVLSDHGYRYKEYAAGQRLIEWLLNVFPHFSKSDDNLWLLDSGAPQAVAPRPEAELSPPKNLNETQQMHSIAFMNWWSENTKLLGEYNSQLSNEEYLRTTVAHHLAFALLGMPDTLFYEESSQQVAFKTGLVSSGGAPIYCILVPNPKNLDGTKQKWALSEFACIGEDTPAGQWLDNVTKDENAGHITLAELNASAAELKDAFEQIAQLLHTYSLSIQAGIIPAERIVADLDAFEKQSDSFVSLYESVLGESYPAELTIAQICEQIDEKNAISNQVAKAVELFCSLMEQVHQLLVDNRFPISGPSTPQQDILALRKQYADPSTDINFNAFDELLHVYRALQCVMSANDCSDEIAVQIENDICPHFSEISYRNAARILIRYEEEEREFLNALDAIEQIIAECKMQLLAFSHGEQHEEISAGLLLEQVAACDVDGIALSQYARLVFPEEMICRMLILAQLDELKQYLLSQNPPTQAQEQVLAALSGEPLPTDLTYYAAAKRLQSCGSLYTELAEKYYILGLPVDTNRCTNALLDIYRERQDRAAFSSIIRLYDTVNVTGLENQVFYLSILCEDGADAALEYAYTHYYIFYHRSGVDVLCTLPDEVLSPEEKAAITERCVQIHAYTELNPLEQAILEGDRPVISGFTEDPAALSELGYTQTQIERLVQCAKKSIDGEFATDNAGIGIRFYNYQRNAHGLAERYMWQALCENPKHVGLDLMHLLAQEGRFRECCQLYECFQKEYSKNPGCRQVYMVSKLQMDPVKSMEHVRMNLQEYLAQSISSPVVEYTLKKLAEKNEPAYSPFYVELLSLRRLLSGNPFIKAIVLQERVLREYCTPSYVKALEIEERYVNSILGTYKTDNYSHGTDAVCIAERVLTFCGSYADAAEAFATFALPDMQALNILWGIYSMAGEEPRLFELAYDYPQLRSEHFDQYLDGLFRRKMYSEFLLEYKNIDGSCARDLQQFIAVLKTEPDSDIALPELEMDGRLLIDSGWFCAWGTLLFTTLAAADRYLDMTRILSLYFDSWLDSMGEDVLRDIISCKDTIAQKELGAIQEFARSQNQESLALYLYHVLDVGDLAELSATYLEDALRNSTLLSSADKLLSLRRIKRVYGQQMTAIDDQIAILEMERVLANAAPYSQLVEAVVQILNDCACSQASLEHILQLIGGSSICFDYRVCRSIEALAERVDAGQLALTHLHNLAMTEKGSQITQFMQFVCLQYANAFAHGTFPRDLTQTAHSNCYRYVQKTRDATGLLCLYFLEQELGNAHKAKFILREMADLPSDVVGERLGNSLSQQLEKCWANVLPSYLNLFMEALETSTLQEITEFINYAGTVSNYSQESVSYILPQLTTSTEERILSEAASDDLIRLLYANHTDGQTWNLITKLPVQDSPLCYAKLQILAAEYDPNIWESCAVYCEKYEQYELLLICLSRWSHNPSLDRVARCRELLEKKLLRNPGFLKQLDDSSMLLDLVKNLCDRVLPIDAQAHTALRALSLIAEKSGIPEALDYFFTKYNDTLLGSNCNLAVVTVVYLLLDGRFEEAQKYLALLNGVLGKMNYRRIVELLARMDVPELRTWTDRSDNRTTLQLVLPDGNRPNIERIAAITYAAIVEEKVPETANVLLRMLEMFPDDYGLYNALFDLCCTKFDGYLPMLHKALRGLSRLNPSFATKTFYRRDQKQYIRLLAALDAVIIARRQTDLITDYSFQTNTGDFYRKAGAANTTPSDVLSINNVRDAAINQLAGLDARDFDSICEAFLGCITGNWQTLILDAWNADRDIPTELSLTIDQVEDVGFTRSLIHVLLQIPAENHPGFLKWLKAKHIHHSPSLRHPRFAPISFVEKYVTGGHFKALYERDEGRLLQELAKCPFEDYSLVTQCLRKYVDQAVKSGDELLYELTLLIGAFVCQPEFQFELLKIADKFFDNSNDLPASRVYHTLLELNKQFDLIHQRVAPTTRSYRSIPAKMREQYESRYRVTALFCGNKDMLRKFASPKVHVWTCINLVCTLLYSKRADEVLRLATYFSGNYATFTKSFLTAMDHAVNDKDKLRLIDTLSGDLMKAYFCYAVKYPYNPGNPKGAVTTVYALTSQEVAAQFNQKYLYYAKSVMARSLKDIKNMSPMHTLLVEARPVHPNASNQKDPQQWAIYDGSEADAQDNQALPFYAQGLAPSMDDVDLEALLQEHRLLPRLSENVQSKLQLSELMVQGILAGQGDGVLATNALLLYGCDRYYAALAAEDTQGTNKLLLEVARIMKRGMVSGYGVEESRRIMPDGLYHLLNSFNLLGDLLESYGKQKTVYNYLRNCIGDALLSSCVGTIYEVLDSLRTCYSSAGHENPDILRENLSSNYFKLATIEANRWMDLKNKVQKLINDEIYKLDRRPVLQVEVHNIGLQRRSGYLYGKIQNIGQIAADNIILQANYGNGTHSQQYVLDYLSPGSQAVFQIDYSTSDGVASTEYFVNLHFAYDEKTYTAVACKGTLQIGEVPEPEYKVISANPNGLIFEIHPQTGEIVNPDFVGREKETAALRELLAGDRFADYNSAMVYGIRRSGKSSLLNYLATYIKANRPNIICVQIDCQALPENNYIQFVFIDSVLSAIELAQPELRLSEEWAALKNQWSNEAFCADQNLQSLVHFYPAVKQMIAEKGIYLIVDEIDRLFERVEASQSNLDGLFGVLSSMLTSPECRKAVHFTICGSNWLIRYNLRGDNKNQLLQRFGEQVIEVGKLPEADAKAVVTLPYRDTPQLTITAEAQNWIWHYTGGLVWHTKLLGNKAIEHTKKAGRYAVYPLDVRQSLSEVISEHWCKQFYEGCESGSEFAVVDAMQSLAPRRHSYVYVSQLRELLGWDTQELQRVLSILRELRVIAPDPVDGQKYRFEMDIYRRYFRSTATNYPRIPEEPDEFRRRRIDSAPSGSTASSAAKQAAAKADTGLTEPTSEEAEDDAFGDLE